MNTPLKEHPVFKGISNGRCHRKHANLQTQYGCADHVRKRVRMESAL